MDIFLKRAQALYAKNVVMLTLSPQIVNAKYIFLRVRRFSTLQGIRYNVFMKVFKVTYYLSGYEDAIIVSPTMAEAVLKANKLYGEISDIEEIDA